MQPENIHRQNIIAVIWDFDRTLIQGYMQSPIFKYFEVDEHRFWDEVNALPTYYRERGIKISSDSIYLNHLLTYVRCGKMKGLNNALLEKLGQELVFFAGLPEFFSTLKALTQTKPAYQLHDIELEHYIVSTGLAAMIRGSKIAPLVEGIYGCELIENPPLPDFLEQGELEIDNHTEVSQIGVLVDNTIKTRFIYEINKGTNKIPSIDVNSKIRHEDRRIPMSNMIYIADGPSDVPVFSVVRKNGGRAYAVYEAGNEAEFAQNDMLLRNGRIDAYGRADYRPKSDTFLWLKTHVTQICDRIVRDREQALNARVTPPPRHLHSERDIPRKIEPEQGTLL
jgi:hypothetical protein